MRPQPISTIVFVDGENFRKSMEKLFPSEFGNDFYLPRSLHWGSLFDLFSILATNENEKIEGYLNRKRTYWYVAESLIFSPDPTDEHKSKVDEIRDKHEEQKIIQEEICDKNIGIEFRRAGSVKYELPSGKPKGEKGVDVKMATDLIMLRDIYEVAIIVSGDQDYIPAIQAVKDSGKRVVNAIFTDKDLKPLPGISRKLNQATDWNFKVSSVGLARELGIKLDNEG